ncbi:hypothetical protein VNI00_000713 [Paramarasmius palmivorus]|uniref:Uncharacterized protein n=1 Tax=Paramarasmius palmivorus TaxID=297713 RepID=A0AAW0E6M8_9AGAR
MSTQKLAEKSRSHILFAPPEGRLRYRDEDFKVLCASTPIPYSNIPRYLAHPAFFEKSCPPKLYCGWRVGVDALSALVVKHYPDHVILSGGEVMSCNTALELPKAIRKELELPPELHHLISIVDGADSEGNFGYALAIGNNYEGLLPRRKYVEPLMQKLFNNKDTEWFLTNRQWKWAPSSSSSYKGEPVIVTGYRHFMTAMADRSAGHKTVSRLSLRETQKEKRPGPTAGMAVPSLNISA